jgi:hypothetical protein
VEDLEGMIASPLCEILNVPLEEPWQKNSFTLGFISILRSGIVSSDAFIKARKEAIKMRQ